MPCGVSRPVAEALHTLLRVVLAEERQAHPWNTSLSLEEEWLAFAGWRDSIESACY